VSPKPDAPGVPLPPDVALARFSAALERRAALLADPQTNVARLCNGATDGLAGLVVERLGEVLVAQLHEGRLALTEDTVQMLCASARQSTFARAVYRKQFPKDRSAALARLAQLHADPQPWLGEPVPAEIPVREHGVTFLVRPYDGYATGLFLDHRTQRVCARELAAGRRVLNAFAYTCGFAVAATLGGAATTVNVDVSKKYLEWGKRNLAANGIDLAAHRFLAADIFDYYRRALRQQHRFDYIILDPPSFGRAKRPQRTFSITADLERLVAGALALLQSGGYLQVSVNHGPTSVARLEQVARAACGAAGRPCRVLAPPVPPADFRGDAEAAKVILVEVGGATRRLSAPPRRVCRAPQTTPKRGGRGAEK
jgi:23S rRNA (cytosine1962-C5)-methyltransferase